jgi:hypothetical protein
MTPRELEEYRAMRLTILERGTARHWVVLAGLAIWSGLSIVAAALTPTPASTLVPLLFLAATFEVVFALHTGVERVGRFVQVFHENSSDRAAWEHVAMAYGRTYGGGGMDAMFSPLFWVATLFNLLPALLAGPLASDSMIVGVVHVMFAARIWSARLQSGKQRARDLERFTALRDQPRN